VSLSYTSFYVSCSDVGLNSGYRLTFSEYKLSKLRRHARDSIRSKFFHNLLRDDDLLRSASTFFYLFFIGSGVRGCIGYVIVSLFIFVFVSGL
jgi:hypothetical protein